MKRLAFLLISALIFTACSSSDYKTLEVPKEGNTYTSNVASASNVAISGYAETLENGELLIVLGIDNQSADTLSISKSVQIQTSESIRSELKSFSSYKSEIMPNTFDTLRLVFSPINNLELYQRTGYEGDFVEDYLLDLTFVEGFEGKNLKLVAGNWWADYKKESNETSMMPFTIVADTAFGQDWKISENEVLSRGVLFKAKAYKMQDSLTLNLELINEGDVEAGIYLSKLSAALNPYNTEKISRIFWLSKGSRWQERMTVYLESDTLTLPADLMIDKFAKPLWPAELKLKKMGSK